MYEIGTPVAGGLAGVGALAATGFEALIPALVAVMVVLAGLGLVRTQMMRQRRKAAA